MAENDDQRAVAGYQLPTRRRWLDLASQTCVVEAAVDNLDDFGDAVVVADIAAAAVFQGIRSW